MIVYIYYPNTVQIPTPQEIGSRILDRDCPSIYKPTSTSELVLRFWEKVSKENHRGCNVWLGKTDKRGYGYIGECRLSKLMGARSCHQISWIMLVGELTPGLELLHACDNPPCLNIDHLSEGTHKQNMREAADRGLMTPPPIYKGKLTDNDIEVIRLLLAGGDFTQLEIAQEYNVHQTTISLISRGKTGVVSRA